MRIPNTLSSCPIAIIGMACVFPRAEDLIHYWDNIAKQVDCITDVPASRWWIEDYFDADPSAPDKTYRGTMIGVDENGALLLRKSDGLVETIMAGDVTLY